MANVVHKKFGHESCPKQPSFGVVGSKKTEFCCKHAGAGMVDVRSNKCGYEGCFTEPSHGVVGSKKAELCSKHAMAGMVNVLKK
ncbi:unnamed protein product, partial [Sphacelaria rigidula]